MRIASRNKLTSMGCWYSLSNIDKGVPLTYQSSLESTNTQCANVPLVADDNGDYLFYCLTSNEISEYPPSVSLEKYRYFRIASISLVNTIDNFDVRWTNTNVPSPTCTLNFPESPSQWMVDAQTQLTMAKNKEIVYGVIYQPKYLLWADAQSLWCLDRQTGQTKWHHIVNKEYSLNYWFDDGTVFITQQNVAQKYQVSDLARGLYFLARCGDHAVYWNGHSCLLIFLGGEDAQIIETIDYDKISGKYLGGTKSELKIEFYSKTTTETKGKLAAIPFKKTAHTTVTICGMVLVY